MIGFDNVVAGTILIKAVGYPIEVGFSQPEIDLISILIMLFAVSLSMASSCISSFSPEDTQVWQQLQRAIASSSGFQRWQLECSLTQQLQGLSLEQRVRRYLRETLETLSY